MDAKVDEGVRTLQARLEACADPGTRSWWEGYVKGGHPFRGVPMARVRREVHRWAEELRLVGWADSEAFDLSLALLKEVHTEDKLAGMLLVQEVLLPAGRIAWEEALSAWARLFEDGAIADWNTCDWFCVKVLGPLAQREGEKCAQAIGDWRASTNLWRRRASAVAFVSLAKKGDEALTGLTGLVLASCDVLLRDPTRFSQTGAGWVLRELSRAEPERVAGFIGERLPLFSRESLASATRKLPQDATRAFRYRGP